MHCTRQVTDNLLWIGANDRRLAMFEGVYSVPDGVSYNSYLLLDEKTVVFDTVDKAVRDRFLENLAYGLKGRKLDYLILQHIEPDHSAVALEVAAKYPEVTLVLNARSQEFVNQFFGTGNKVKTMIVKEGDILCTGEHKLHFVMAPMVHWPEVMVTYDEKTGTLFSADAFGCFGALNGALFADEVNFERDYLDEARRYYSNIVGKYGTQVSSLFSKAAGLPIDMLCPLHGFVWRNNLNEILVPYTLWSRYEPEEQGVMIAYASVYGNTENAAEILSTNLREAGIKTVMFDVSVTPASNIVSAAFKWSHLVFASTTYNAGIFVTMEALIYDLVAHNIQNRTVALIENGSWAATSGQLMKDHLSLCRDMRFVGDASIVSSVSPDKNNEIIALAKAIADSFPPKKQKANLAGGVPKGIDVGSMWKIPYGLYLVSAKDGEKDNGCIVNTVAQVTVSPLQIAVSISKDNLTHDMIANTGKLAISVLTKDAPFSLFKHFGLTSGRDADKFKDMADSPWKDAFVRLENGLYGLNNFANAVMSAEVVSKTDCGSHTMFIAEITQALDVSDNTSCSYDYYLNSIKPKPQPPKEGQVGHICIICGYIYEGSELPADFICPLCKHGVADFERL